MTLGVWVTTINNEIRNCPDDFWSWNQNQNIANKKNQINANSENKQKTYLKCQQREWKNCNQKGTFCK